MDQDKINKLKKDIIAIGRLLWDKELASGLNGNISVRVDKETILLNSFLLGWQQLYESIFI